MVIQMKINLQKKKTWLLLGYYKNRYSQINFRKDCFIHLSLIALIFLSIYASAIDSDKAFQQIKRTYSFRTHRIHTGGTFWSERARSWSRRRPFPCVKWKLKPMEEQKQSGKLWRNLRSIINCLVKTDIGYNYNVHTN